MRINPIGKHVYKCAFSFHLFNSRKIKPTQINGVSSQHVPHVYHEFHYKRYTMYYNTEDLPCIHTNKYIMYYNTTDISCISLPPICLFYNTSCISYQVFHYRGYNRNVFYYSTKWSIMCFFAKS